MPRGRKRNARATRPINRRGNAHYYPADYSGGYGAPGQAIRALKTSQKATTRARKAVKSAPPSAAKTRAVAKVSKARTAVKTAEHAVSRLRAVNNPRRTVKVFKQARRAPGRYRSKRGYGSKSQMLIPLTLTDIITPTKRGRGRPKGSKNKPK